MFWHVHGVCMFVRLGQLTEDRTDLHRGEIIIGIKRCFGVLNVHICVCVCVCVASFQKKTEMTYIEKMFHCARAFARMCLCIYGSFPSSAFHELRNLFKFSRQLDKLITCFFLQIAILTGALTFKEKTAAEVRIFHF